MGFWETMKGNHLADVLMQCLPELAGREQYSIELLDMEKMQKYVAEHLAKGERYIQHIVNADGTIFLIMEK